MIYKFPSNKALLAYSYSTKFNWNLPPETLFSIIKSESSSDPSFLKNNSTHFAKYILSLLENRKWRLASRVSREIPYEKMADWKKFHQIGEGIRKHINEDNFQKIGNEEKNLILETAMNFKYEHIVKQNKEFVKFIAAQIAKNKSALWMYATYFLGICPQIFRQHQEQIKKMVFERMEERSSKLIIYNGFKGLFWRKQFLEELQTVEYNDYIIDRFIAFTDMQRPVIYEDNPNPYKQKTATEAKIGVFLKDLGYNFKENVLVNGIEVDFAFPNNLILQYNGIFHFNIAYPTPRPLLYELWKQRAFSRKKIVRINLPFYEWEDRPHQKSQRAYLMEKIQFGMLQSVLPKKQYEEVKALHKTERPVI